MKRKYLSKIVPLITLFALTACSGSTSVERTFAGEKVEITIPSEKSGYLKYADRILKKIERYADPSYVNNTLKKYLASGSTNSKTLTYNFTDDFDLYEMLYNLTYYDRGYLPYDNGYKALWKKVINEGRRYFNNEEYQLADELSLELYNADFTFSGYYHDLKNDNRLYAKMTCNGEFTYDLRPVLESYALGKIHYYFGEDFWNGRVPEHEMRIGDNNILVNYEKKAQSITIKGPYGKPVIINNINRALIHVASAVDSKVIIDPDDQYNRAVASTKFISTSGPWIYNDCVIVVKTDLYYKYDVFAPAYAFRRMKENYSSYNDSHYSETEEHIYYIIFKNGEISYCSSALDVKYEGASYGLNQTVKYPVS